MIYWRGIGAVVLIIPFLFAVINHRVIEYIFKDDEYYAKHSWPLALTWFVAATTTWVFGKYLNSREKKIVDNQTGEVRIYKPIHDLYDTQMQYWAIPMLVAAIIFLFY